MLKLYRFHWDCGRMGDLYGVFAVNHDGENILRASFGEHVDFGEVLGKHSSIEDELDESAVTAIDASPEDVATVLRVLAPQPSRYGWWTISGYNPLDYLDTDEQLPEVMSRAGVAPIDPAHPPIPETARP